MGGVTELDDQYQAIKLLFENAWSVLSELLLCTELAILRISFLVIDVKVDRSGCCVARRV